MCSPRSPPQGVDRKYQRTAVQRTFSSLGAAHRNTNGRMQPPIVFQAWQEGAPADDRPMARRLRVTMLAKSTFEKKGRPGNVRFVFRPV